MVENTSSSRKLFLIGNYSSMAVLAFLCLFPILHVLAVSFSSGTAASSGKVAFWPVDATLSAYQYVTRNDAFFTSLLVSVKRVLLGSTLQIVFIALLAYPLSQESEKFKFRTAYVWYFFITIIFSGGLVPAYMIVRETRLIDTLGALIVPNAVPVFSVILMLNFFRSLPRELAEAAHLDGAGHFGVLTRIYLPLSKAGLATLLLFSIVGHWNSWFDGIIYMNTPEHYPLQSYLQSIIIAGEDTALSAVDEKMFKQLSDRTLHSAQIFLGAVPILLVYPFLQKYFMTGIVLGSVKE